MLSRPTFDQIYCNLASSLALRSTCSRLQVGCVIVSSDDERVLSIGYNGGAKGVFNDCLSQIPGQCGHAHAEINALVKLNYNDPCGKKLYVTTSPCFNCAVLIVNAGISEVIYIDEYRNREGLGLLEKAGIKTRKFAEGKL